MSEIKQYPTKEFLNEYLLYDKEIGKLYWKKLTSVKSRINIGDEAGRINKGYASITINGKLYLSHRIIYIMNYGNIDNLVIDHINGDKLDNRLKNLRAVPIIINNQNQFRHRNGDIPGINFNKLENKWKIRITKFFNDIPFRCSYGTYKTFSEAKEVYDFVNNNKLLELLISINYWRNYGHC